MFLSLGHPFPVFSVGTSYKIFTSFSDLEILLKTPNTAVRQ